jgi:hypothetical protein
VTKHCVAFADEAPHGLQLGYGNDSRQNGPFGEWSAIPLELHTALAKESYSESSNCGDMAKFVSNRCHIPGSIVEVT